MHSPITGLEEQEGGRISSLRRGQGFQQAQGWSRGRARLPQNPELARPQDPHLPHPTVELVPWVPQEEEPEDPWQADPKFPYLTGAVVQKRNEWSLSL